jgi:hypothetical protein
MSDDQLILRVRLSLKGRPIKSFSFQQDVITIGRDPEADIFLDNQGISREHARIERLPNGQYSLRDSGSANGTYVNDEPVKSALLYSSDVVRIGKFSLWLTVEQDRREPSKATEAHRAYPEFAAPTIMLSTEELDRLMKTSGDQSAQAKPRSIPPAQTPDPVQARSESPSARPATRPYVERPRRALGLVWVGLVVIVATSLGAGFAWLFLR